VEAVHQHIFRMDIFNSHHVQEHVVSKMETRIKWIRLPLQYLFCILRLQLLVGHQDGYPSVIKSTPSSSSRHLDVFSSAYEPELISIKFLHACEYNSLGRHVDTHCERFCRKQYFEQSFLEKQLNDFFDDRNQPTMMEANPTT